MTVDKFTANVLNEDSEISVTITKKNYSSIKKKTLEISLGYFDSSTDDYMTIVLEDKQVSDLLIYLNSNNKRQK